MKINLEIVEKRLALALPGLSPNAADEVSFNGFFMQDALARAYVKMRDVDKPVTEYERLITFDPKVVSWYLIHPTFHYRLGKLYEQKGAKDKAKAEYARFLDLWKDADPGWDEVEDAKARAASPARRNSLTTHLKAYFASRLP